MSNKLYFIFSKDFPLDINTGSWSIEDDEPDKYYFIPESKINYGLKFHKLFFNDKNEFNKNLDPFNRDFMDVVVDKFVIPLDAEEHIEDYANFLGIDEIIFDNDHKYHKYFYYDFPNTEKFELLIIYKLLINSGNREYLNLFLSNSEVATLKEFMKKYDLENILDSFGESTKDFLEQPLGHGAAALMSGSLLPIDLDAIDNCKESELDEKIKFLETEGYKVINNNNLVKAAYRSLFWKI